ncbi:transketolase protein 2 like [Daphnia sinensis]|uniref:Transketolase protein 2 like n=1 Tax=Daphnia sinensis TaxID=1820382 RepID=A0AAD5PLU0_9CRUS|nr:transketolase protein 2 like [Daphnia sinensis]
MKKYTYTEKKDTRSGFGAGLLEAGKKNDQVVALCADLIGSLKMDAFIKEFPDRFYQVHLPISQLVACMIKSDNQLLTQIKTLTLGEDGATHQILEDIGMMKMLPGMVVINPCDYNQTKAATIAIADYHGPVYLRFGRPAVPVFTDPDQKFEIGKAWMVNEGTDVSIFATGHLVWSAIEAGEKLAEEGINVEIINIHTIKPLDAEAVLKSVAKTGCVVSAEEHNRIGGLGDSIAQLFSNKQSGATRIRSCKRQLR